MDQKSVYRGETNSNKAANTFWEAIKNHGKMVCAITLIAGLIGAALNFVVARPAYESSASVLLTQVTKNSSGYIQNNSLESIASSAPRVPPLSIKTHMGLIADEAVISRVIERLRLGEQGYTAKKLAAAIKVSSPGENANVIKVTARCMDPGFSADVANAVCSEYGLMLIDINKKLINSSLQTMLAETEVLKADLRKAVSADEKQNITSALTYLSGKIYNARIVRDIDLGTVGVVLLSPATPSPSPVKTGIILNTALALFLGLAVSVLLAFGLELPGRAYQAGSLPNAGSSYQPGPSEQN